MAATCVAIITASPECLAAEDAWQRHAIDTSSRGADGVRLADVNGDGRPDVVTGWEEGGKIRVCLQPPKNRIHERWSAVTVGIVKSPEDAVFVDLNNDGAVDVVSCCEGSERAVFIHWAPQEKSQLLKSKAWRTKRIPVTHRKTQWMFALPMQVDGRHGPDIIVGAKNKDACIGWLQAPEQPQQMDAWKFHTMCSAGWIMSLAHRDIDNDGDMDIVATDRRGPTRGCFWLENPGQAADQTQPWARHIIGGQNAECMFLCFGDVDRDNREDILFATRGGPIHVLRRTPEKTPTWNTHTVSMPGNTGTGKAVACADLNLDGHSELVVTCENAKKKHGVFILRWKDSPRDEQWEFHPVSGSDAGDGVKFDVLELIDLDGDGDHDILTCEERDNLGVFWYENPAR